MPPSDALRSPKKNLLKSLSLNTRRWALFKKLYIVSFAELYRDYAAMTKMYYLYEVFSLGELVDYVLRLIPVMDHKEAIWDEIQKRFGEEALDQLTADKLDELDLFLDLLVEAVDNELTKHLPGCDVLELTTVKWINPTDVLLGVINE